LQSSRIWLQIFAIPGKCFESEAASCIKLEQLAIMSLTDAEQSAKLVSPVASITWQCAWHISPAIWQSPAARTNA